jgi:hypothetical protein
MRKEESFDIVTRLSTVNVVRRQDGEDVEYFAQKESSKQSGELLSIDFYTDSLINVLHALLFPLRNLAEVIGRDRDDDDDPPPLFYLFEHLIEEVGEKMNNICSEVEDKVGGISLERTDCQFWGLPKNCLLGAVVTPISKELTLAEIENEQDQDKRIMMLVGYMTRNGSEEDKTRAEKILNAALPA